jgi:hypothetical protein
MCSLGIAVFAATLPTSYPATVRAQRCCTRHWSGGYSGDTLVLLPANSSHIKTKCLRHAERFLDLRGRLGVHCGDFPLDVSIPYSKGDGTRIQATGVDKCPRRAMCPALLISCTKTAVLDIVAPRPPLWLLVHVPNRKHFWELNKRGCRVSRVVDDLVKYMLFIRALTAPENA